MYYIYLHICKEFKEHKEKLRRLHIKWDKGQVNENHDDFVHCPTV